MPHTTQTSDFWGWYLRHNNRTVWKYFSDAGIDVFAAGPSNNPQAFLDLTNVLPAMSGGLNRRWGVTTQISATPTALVSAVRNFNYSYPQDASNVANTANTNLWIATDNQSFYPYTDTGVAFTGPSLPTNYTVPGNVFACVSRGWFCYSNGLSAPRKVNLSYTTSNTDSLLGIAVPHTVATGETFSNFPCAYVGGLVALGNSGYSRCSGLGYTSAPAVTVTDATGSGTGCTITTTIGVNGEVIGATITAAGTGYSQAVATVAAPPAGGQQAYIVLYTQINSGAPNSGKVVGWDFGGPISFIAGRQYAVLLQNSVTGHTSDVPNLQFSSVAKTLATSPTFLALTEAITGVSGANAATIPIYATAQNMQAGFTQNELTIQIPRNNLDPQIDTVILVAGADGQGVSTLYEIATFPLSSFTSVVSGGESYYAKAYMDTLPDTYGDFYTAGPTLLGQDIWSQQNVDGSNNGVALNSPPPTNLKYLTLHQGRMFGTDGKSIFFSKSLDEVTTSSGLITSRYEEAWPGDYQLSVALNNEQINSLRSDGTNLHIGTEKSIFTLYGSDPDNFSIPAQAFAETGVYNNDAWAVVYVEGQPAGFVWLTPDFKVMHSDFATYREIGTPIYPLLQTADPTKAAQAKVLSLTQGPYNFAIIALVLQGNTQPDLFIYETRLGKWYHWTLPQNLISNISTALFVYQYPAYTASTKTPGTRYLFFWQGGHISFPSSYFLTLNYFDPTKAVDFTSNKIPWNIKTSWQDLGDATAIKVINEIEMTGDDSPFVVALYGATSQAHFDMGGVLLRAGNSVQGPMAAMQTQKFYTAGANTAQKYYSIQIGPSSPGTSAPVLTSFSLESYPMARI